MAATTFHSVEGDRIPSLKSHGLALEDELCFPGVLSDNRDAPANLLRHFYGCLMPRTCCFYGKRTEDVGAGQLGVGPLFVRLALCCSVSCCTWCNRCAAYYYYFFKSPIAQSRRRKY